MKEQTKKNLKTAATVTGLALGATYLVMRHIAKKQYPDSVYANQPEEQNPVEGRKVVFVEDVNDPVNADGKQGHLEAVANTTHIPTFYEKYIKRGFDVVLSFGGLVVLAPVYVVTALAIKADDPGPVFFKQKRVGTDKSYFELLKFRSMSVNTPKDVPTHMLQNGGITKVGAFIRKASIDELPQLWNIFRGNMSVIGPRPALWNQDYLTAERDKYGANDVKPGLTGLAQISGRDELEIEDKAKYDGVYAEALKKSSLSGFVMDCKLFLGSVFSVLKKEGIVEGGTGALAKEYAKSKHLSQEIEEEHEKFSLGNAPLVSVIIATYRRKESLEKAIKSIINQTYSNIEIIVVDDNAEEKWNNIVNEIIEKCRSLTEIPILYIKNEYNIGSAKTRNTGINKSRGEYVTFLDDDDIYLPPKIECQVCDMINNNADYSITDLFLYYEDGTLCEKRTRDYLKKECDRLLLKHLKYHMTGTDTMMFARKYLTDIGGFEPIDVGDEYYLMCKAIQAGGKFVYLPRSDIKAYVHTEENGLSSGIGKINGENELYKFKESFFTSMSKNDICYIKMRHHAVLAFAHKRSGNLAAFLHEGICSFLSSPLACLQLLKELK
ncbi:MAG: sugar transferase [Ruminococcus sp.]|nr:sugar transferase [Ruminococcus sp.]